jgi:tRNA ligase
VGGFVVCTHVTKPPRGKGNCRSVEESPYDAGSLFFFKVKFDEPYMMYCDWCKLTKMILLSKGNASLSVKKLLRVKLNIQRCRCMSSWMRLWIVEQYTKGKGVIETRERFLWWMETGRGRDAGEGKERKTQPRL